MKLIRFGEAGAECPGLLLDDGRRIDASSFTDDYNGAFFDDDGLVQLLGWFDANGTGAPEVLQDVRLGPPVARPGKIICIGLNFRDHARESGLEPPPEPVIFFKATSAICGPYDDLIIPKGSSKTDYEIELAVVIGKRASGVEESVALEHVAGYTMMNDYSERAFQLEHGGQWVKGKSCDTFAPLGPFLATPDELPNGDAGNLPMWLRVNGEFRQNSSTENMIFPLSQVVSYVSRFMTLEPGDVISTGTPAGVGMGFDPPKFLKPGDIVEYGIEGLGQAHQQACPA